MSDGKESSPPLSTRPRNRLLKGCLIPVLVLLLLMCLGIVPLTFAFLLILPFGWINFLAATLPRVSWDWGTLSLGVLCAGLILWLGHRFFGWLSQHIATARGKNFSWPWRWTWCGFVGVILFFLVGMAVAGAAHQIGWIVSNKECLFEEQPRKMNHYLEMRDVQYVVQECLSDTSTTSDLRQEIAKTLEQRGHQSSWLPSGMQSLHLLMLVGSNAKVDGILIFPRDPEAQSNFGGLFVGRTDERPVPAKELRSFIETNEARLVAF